MTLTPEMIVTLLAGGAQVLVLGSALVTTQKFHGRRIDNLEKKLMNGTLTDKFVTKETLHLEQDACRTKLQGEVARLADAVDRLNDGGIDRR